MKYPKLIAWWHGTDALKLVMYPPFSLPYRMTIPFFRLFWRLMWRFFTHYVHDDYKKRALLEFGIPEHKIEVKHTGSTVEVYPKKNHSKFLILFYLPEGKYQSWIYGREYYEYLNRWYHSDWLW